jgi:cellulose biosynthesis protein BcsQ
LVVDLDQQSNLTFAFAVDPAVLQVTVVDVLAPRNSVSAEDAVLHDVQGVRGLDLLSCDERVEALDTQLRSETLGVFKLKDALEPLLENYDRVLMDCPPNAGELTVSALLAADEIVCPVKMGDSNALRGLSRLTQTVEKLKRRGATVRFKSLVRVECDRSQLSYRLNHQALQRLARRLKLPVARTELRARAAWRTAITQSSCWSAPAVSRAGPWRLPSAPPLPDVLSCLGRSQCRDEAGGVELTFGMKSSMRGTSWAFDLSLRWTATGRRWVCAASRRAVPHAR